MKVCDDTEVDIGLKSGQLNRLKVFPWPSCLTFFAISEDIVLGNFCISVMSNLDKV